MVGDFGRWSSECVDWLQESVEPHFTVFFFSFVAAPRRQWVSTEASYKVCSTDGQTASTVGSSKKIYAFSLFFFALTPAPLPPTMNSRKVATVGFSLTKRPLQELNASPPQPASPRPVSQFPPCTFQNGKKKRKVWSVRPSVIIINTNNTTKGRLRVGETKMSGVTDLLYYRYFVFWVVYWY